MVVAMTALVIACAGTATAATVLIHSSSQIGNGVVTGTNIHAATITGRQIKAGAIGANQLANGSVGTSKLTASALRTLAAGGPTGSTATAAGSAIEWDRQNGPTNVAGGGSVTVMTATGVPAGVYAIFGETNLSDTQAPGSLLEPEPTDDAQCSLNVDGDQSAYGSTILGGEVIAGSGDVTMQITHTFAATDTITMSCAAVASWQATGSSIIAIRLSSAPKNAVSG